MSQRVSPLHFLSPYVRLAHDFRCPPGFAIGRRRINDHALLYFKRGRGTFFIGRTSHTIEPGTLFIIRPDIIHSFTCVGAGSVHMLNLHFDLIQRPGSENIHYERKVQSPNPRRRMEVLSADPNAPDSLPWRMKVDHETAYEFLFHSVLRLFPFRDLANQLRLKAAFIELLSFLFRQVRAEAVSPRLLHHLPQLERAANFMGAALDHPLSLAEIAREASLSRSYFSSCFTAYYQVSPAKFHLRQRIEKSAMELIFSPRSIKQVAADFGFETVHHFSRCFKQVMGMPPAAYRRAYGPLSAIPTRPPKDE